MSRTASRPGYVFLITVLVIGLLSSSLVATYLMLATDLAKGSTTMREGSQALLLARSCIERAISTLRQNPDYLGGETIVLASGSCYVAPTQGVGYTGRTLCTSGTAGQSTRYLQADLAMLLPSVIVSEWEEVGDLSDCGV